ncbi:MAG: hypothetical protein SWH61_01140 [Thermodesulfobacteriota bacterium]|nr:hypothetical protein [Thermodesulfobacteriota bacterium]
MTFSFIEPFFSVIAKGFSPAVYLLATKIQGLMWSAADITLIFFLLKIVDVVMSSKDGKKITIRYYLLLVSAMLTPFLIVADTADFFFRLESIIFGIQFAVLLYTVCVDIKIATAYLRSIVNDLPSPPHER